MAKPKQAVVRYVDDGIKKEKKQVVVDRELSRIYQQHGTVTADLILEVARSPKEPLHNYFEWDNDIAAEKYRKAQAYMLVMSSRFVAQLVEDGKLATPTVVERARVRKLVSAYRGDGFRLRNEVLADDERRQAVIETKKGVLRSWCQSTIDIEELRPLRALILENL